MSDEDFVERALQIAVLALLAIKVHHAVLY